MDVTLERGLPPAQDQVIERPAESGGANSAEKQLLQLLRKFKKQQAEGVDVETTKRQIAQLLILGSVQQVDDKGQDRNYIILKKIEQDLDGLITDASLDQFTQLLIESIKNLKDSKLSKLVSEKKQFTKKELMKIIAKLPIKEQKELAKQLKKLAEKDMEKYILGGVEIPDEGTRVSVSDTNTGIFKNNTGRSMSMEGPIGHWRYNDQKWDGQLLIKINYLSKKEMNVACRLMSSSFERYIQQLQKKSSKNHKFVLELKKKLRSIEKSGLGKNSPVGSIRLLRMLPTGTIVKVLAKLDKVFASSKDYEKRSVDSDIKLHPSLKLFAKQNGLILKEQQNKE